MAMSLDAIFNTSSVRYDEDVGVIRHWFSVGLAELAAVAGLISTVLVTTAVLKDPVFFSSFKALCIGQSISDVSALAFQAFWLIPVIAGRQPNDAYWFRATMSFFACMYIVENVIVCVITVDRYCAISKPELYDRWFTVRNCIRMGFGAVLYSFVPFGFYMYDCPFWLDLTHYQMSNDFRNTSIGRLGWPCGYTTVAMTYVHCAPIVIVGFVMTILSIRKLRLASSTVSPQNTARQSQLRKAKRLLNTSAANCVFQYFMLASYNSLAPALVYFGYKTPVLFASITAWGLSHTFNSCALLFFNPSIRSTAGQLLRGRKQRVDPGEAPNRAAKTLTVAELELQDL